MATTNITNIKKIKVEINIKNSFKVTSWGQCYAAVAAGTSWVVSAPLGDATPGSMSSMIWNTHTREKLSSSSLSFLLIKTVIFMNSNHISRYFISLTDSFFVLELVCSVYVCYGLLRTMCFYIILKRMQHY